jgi:UDP-N-acetyl-D-mannosaminuronic acid dehydrogenase
VRVAPALEAASGLAGESDFFTVFSPERVFSGRIFRDLDDYPKLVGGLSAAGERRGCELYASFIDAPVWPMQSAEAAELTKPAETTYRDVNIAFANELARFADARGLDVQRVIEAANTQPFSHIHLPGIAVGGHCIPVYPRFYLEGDPSAALPRAARAVNESMPAYAVGRLEEALARPLEGARVLILGAAYRGGVKETAFSGVFGTRDALRERGATVVVSDPLYDDDELRALGLTPWDEEPVDAVIVQADHEEYRSLGPADVAGAAVVLDGRGIMYEQAFCGPPALVRLGRPSGDVTP